MSRRQWRYMENNLEYGCILVSFGNTVYFSQDHWFGMIPKQGQINWSELFRGEEVNCILCFVTSIEIKVSFKNRLCIA